MSATAEKFRVALERRARFVCAPCSREGPGVVAPVVHRVGPPVDVDLNGLGPADRLLAEAFDGALLFWARFDADPSGSVNESYVLRVLSRKASLVDTQSFRDEYAGDDPWLAGVIVVATVQSGDVYVVHRDDAGGEGRPVYLLCHEDFFVGCDAEDAYWVAPNLLTLIREFLADPLPATDVWRAHGADGNQYYVERVDFDDLEPAQ